MNKHVNDVKVKRWTTLLQTIITDAKKHDKKYGANDIINVKSDWRDVNTARWL